MTIERVSYKDTDCFTVLQRKFLKSFNVKENKLNFDLKTNSKLHFALPRSILGCKYFVICVNFCIFFDKYEDF